jgi:menaquinone-9 beta-reductase
MEQCYMRAWNAHFRKRLWFGRQVQNLFGNQLASTLAVNLAVRVPVIAKMIMKGTHGKPFN